MTQRDQGSSKLLVGAAAGTGVTAIVAALLARRPAAAAPPEAQNEYMILLLEEIWKSNVTIGLAIQQLAAALGGISPDGAVFMPTPWVGKEPVQIFQQPIAAVGTYDSDQMVNFTQGKRLLFKVESSLDQAATVQLVGGIFDTMTLGTNIGAAVPIAAGGNISIGLDWDDWYPFVGVQIVLAVAPTTGLLTIWAVIQE